MYKKVTLFLLINKCKNLYVITHVICEFIPVCDTCNSYTGLLSLSTVITETIPLLVYFLHKFGLSSVNEK